MYKPPSWGREVDRPAGQLPAVLAEPIGNSEGTQKLG